MSELFQNTPTNTGPGKSELYAVDTEIMYDVIAAVFSLFRHRRLCMPVGYNLKKIKALRLDVEGNIEAGRMEWAIDVKPFKAEYMLTAYVDMEWDAEAIRIPACFRDHRNVVRGFSDVAIKRFLYAGTDLTDHIPPFMSRT